MAYCADHLADYIIQISYEDLPSRVIEQAKWVILDAVGAALASWGTPWCKAVYETFSAQGGAADSSIIYFGGKIPEANAALINAMFVQGLDFNDELSGIHTGGILPPAALAVGESLYSSGQEIITSVVVGYDIASRLAEAADAQSLFERGYQPSAVLGGFAAAATAAKLHKLGHRETRNALGISGSYAAGSIEFIKDGADTKRFNIAKAAQTGIIATHLAKAGMTGPGSIFEGQFGIFALMAQEANPSKLIEDLGTRFDILDTSFKYYPCCDGAFCPLEAVFALVNENGICVDDIESIHFKIKSFLVPFLANYDGDSSRKYQPQSVTDVQFSLPYLTALGIINHGELRTGDINRRNFNDREVLDLARKVSAEADEELDKMPFRPMSMPAIASLTTKTGSTFTKRVDFYKGDPRKPFSCDEYLEKFRSNTKGALQEDKVELLIESIMNLDQLSNIVDLMPLAVS